jgi:hypothetical protein
MANYTNRLISLPVTYNLCAKYEVRSTPQSLPQSGLKPPTRSACLVAYSFAEHHDYFEIQRQILFARPCTGIGLQDI